MKRREFMTNGWKTLNIASFLTLGGFVGSLGATAGASGHPDAIICYECRACVKDCPVNFDPAGFVLAGRTNNPGREMLAEIDVEEYKMLTGDDITIEQLYEMDPFIKVYVKEREDPQLVKNVVGKGLTLTQTYKMPAKDVAEFCLLCRLCSVNCPVGIELTDYTIDLKINDRYGKNGQVAGEL